MSFLSRLIFVGFGFYSSISLASTAVRLFEIERNTNANYVCYDANLNEDGTLDSSQPVSAYWIMAAEDGHREELTALEKKYAYGFKISMRADHTYLLTTKTSGNQEFIVESFSDGVVARTEFDGQAVYLKKMFVQAKGTTFPKVDFVKLTGIDTRSGAEIEKIIRP